MTDNILDNEMSYDEICGNNALIKDEYYNEDYTNSEYKAFASTDKLYTNEENANKLKESIYSLLNELANDITKRFKNKDINIEYNYEILNYDEVIARILVNNNCIELKLGNDYMCECNNEINTIYITLYLNGKGIFTESVEIIKEEYEFTGMMYVPINEIELYYKSINKENFISKILLQINNLIQ